MPPSNLSSDIDILLKHTEYTVAIRQTFKGKNFRAWISHFVYRPTTKVFPKSYIKSQNLYHGMLKSVKVFILATAIVFLLE